MPCPAGSKLDGLPSLARAGGVTRTSRCNTAVDPDMCKPALLLLELVSIFYCTVPIRSSPSAAAMELSAENQAELVSAREQAILLLGLMGARPGAVLGAVNTSAPTTAAPSDAAAPSVPSTEGTPSPMDTQAREGKRGSDWDSGKGADKYRRSAQVKGGGYGTGWGNKRQNEWWKKAKNDFDEENKREKDVEEIRNLCVSLSRLVLRHDDQQAIDRTEKGFILFCQTNGMLSVIPDMVRCIEAWTKMKEDNPTGLTLPRRAAMLKQLLDLWFIRLEVVAETEESLSQAKNMLILNQAGQVPYLQYNRQTEQLEIKPDREPMELKTVLETIKELQDLVLLPNTTLRFHAARRLTSQPKGDIVPMMLEIGVRTREADRAWELLARLCQRGACRAVAMSLRQERMGRSALAKQVQQMVEGLSGPYS